MSKSLAECDPRLGGLCLLAWVGEDEFGSGEIGIKQGRCPAGYIPLVAIGEHRDRMDRMAPQLEAQARLSGKRIRLVKFVPVAVERETEAGA